MKKTILSVTTLIVALAFANNSKAQVNVSININSQPDWGPGGYDYVEYYYLPDIEAYYYVPRHQFVYISGGNWIFSAHLPPAYRNYDLYRGYKVVINQPRAYRYYDSHRVKYSKHRGHYGKPYKHKGHGRGHGHGHH
ncbi:hypothetical protein [Terrimonas alba]|uniref:hypothetical protein n=1 Tax=Terrimonas alba TaxID=3349636 RepID=UPI0035F4B983